MVTRLYKFKSEVHISQIVLSFIILVLPFALFFHLFFSETSYSISFLNLNIEHGFNNNRGWAWNLLSITIPLIMLLIWFVTSINRWRHFILIPIFLYITRMVIRIAEYPDFLKTNLTLFAILIALLAVVVIVYFDYIIYERYREKFLLTIRLRLFNRDIRGLYFRLSQKYTNTGNGLRFQMEDNQIRDLFYLKFIIKDEIDKYTNFDDIKKYKNLDVVFIFTLIFSCAFFLPIR